LAQSPWVTAGIRQLQRNDAADKRTAILFEWIVSMDDHRVCERFEDMSPRGKLVLIQQPDGDIIVSIHPSDLEDFNRKGLFQSAEFCTVGTGGGQSPRTREALLELMNAIDEDNRESPQYRK
jgi:hypothetical protein